MKRIACLTTLALLALGYASASAQPQSVKSMFVDPDAKGRDEFDIVKLGRRLKGRIIDHTSNHAQDNRIWSRSLHQWRDLYLYLPPAYNKNQAYPIMIYMHPFALDERTFLRVIPMIDEAIACGKLPPIIIAAPDGSIDGEGCLAKPGSFFLNSNAGPYEDYVLQDVWDYVTNRYPIRTERNAHVLCGVSMGGFAAYNLGIRHRDAFGIVIGIHPPLNTRWADVDGNPRAKFDPRRWGWRTGFDTPNEVLANFGGLIKIKLGPVVNPVFGVGDEALLGIAENNPLELVLKTKLRNGDLSMFVGYAGRDEFNIDAQCDSFLYFCKFRGIGVAVAFEPDGHHDGITARKLAPAAIRWLAPQLEAIGCQPEIYSPSPR
jgi:pimeloyl-ACP methyl ester carboxylesterase